MAVFVAYLGDVVAAVPMSGFCRVLLAVGVQCQILAVSVGASLRGEFENHVLHLRHDGVERVENVVICGVVSVGAGKLLFFRASLKVYNAIGGGTNSAQIAIFSDGCGDCFKRVNGVGGDVLEVNRGQCLYNALVCVVKRGYKFAILDICG